MVPNALNCGGLQRLPQLFRRMPAFVAIGIRNWNRKYVSNERHVGIIKRMPGIFGKIGSKENFFYFRKHIWAPLSLYPEFYLSFQNSHLFFLYGHLILLGDIW